MNDDVDSNIVAVEAAKLACTGKSRFGSQTSKTYSSVFNLACFQIASGNFELALETLEKAKSKLIINCRNMLARYGNRWLRSK